MNKLPEGVSWPDVIRKIPCMICGNPEVDVHHWKSRGAGGGDTPDNLVPLCRKHHNEFHQMGVKTFSETYHHTLQSYSQMLSQYVEAALRDMGYGFQRPGSEKRVSFAAQFERVTKKKNGEGQIVLGFGLDAMKSIQKVEEWNHLGGVNFIVVVAPYKE